MHWLYKPIKNNLGKDLKGWHLTVWYEAQYKIGQEKDWKGNLRWHDSKGFYLSNSNALYKLLEASETFSNFGHIEEFVVLTRDGKRGIHGNIVLEFSQDEDQRISKILDMSHQEAFAENGQINDLLGKDLNNWHLEIWYEAQHQFSSVQHKQRPPHIVEGYFSRLGIAEYVVYERLREHYAFPKVEELVVLTDSARTLGVHGNKVLQFSHREDERIDRILSKRYAEVAKG
jgi:hypothetical protein